MNQNTLSKIHALAHDQNDPRIFKGTPAEFFTKAAEATKPQGPYYDNDRGELCIPSDKDSGQEWERRGLLFDAERGVWWIALDPRFAESQVKKARAVFERVTPALREFRILYYTKSDCTAEVTVKAANFDAAAAMVRAREDCDAVIG